MGCVNRNSKEFRKLAAKNNVSHNILELITHKYWIERGSEESLPSDVYIQAQLGNTWYEESGKHVRELWQKRYSSPTEFDSRESMEVALKEATKYFPKNAIAHYQNEDGKYILSVKKPVRNADYSREAFFRKQEGYFTKSLDLGIEDSREYTIDKVRELFDRFNADRTSKHLADRIFKTAENLGLKVTFDNSLPISTVGRYVNNNSITFKKSFFEKNLGNDMKAPVLLHEVIHAISMYALSDSMESIEKPEALEDFKKEMNSIFQDVRDNKALEGERGITDLNEFVAELANPIFRKKLQGIDDRSFWTKIIDAFKSLFNLHPSSTYYNRAMNSLESALNAFDLDTYLIYNGMKNTLQQGFGERQWQFRNMEEQELKASLKDYFMERLPISTTVDASTKELLQKAKEEAGQARNQLTYASVTDDTGEQQRRAVQDRMRAFSDKYRNLIRTIKPFGTKFGGMSFSVTFKNSGELLRMQNADITAQLSLIDSMSKDDLLSELALIEQEYADFDLISASESKNNDNFAEKEEFTNILNDFIYGRKQFNNLTKEENDVARRDRILAAAEIHSRRNGSPNREESQDARNERQEKQVEEWAKQAGVWHEDALAFGSSFGKEMRGGQESHVYANPTNISVVKVKNTTQYHDLQEFLDGIVLHNSLFPETAYKVLGFGNDGEGFVAILEQPYVVGEVPTQEQITEFVKSIEPDAQQYESELGNGRYKTPYTLIHDLSPRNAIITPQGNIAIIDGIIRPNTADEGKGGQRNTDYSIEDTKDSLTQVFETSETGTTESIESNQRRQEIVQKNLDEYEKLTNQINRLLDSNLISASEIRHVAELVVNSISDNITLLQQREGLAQRQFETLSTALDFQTASRKEIIDAIGINNLIYRAKLLFDPKNADYKDIDTLLQAALIVDNWDAIITIASDIFVANEGFGVGKDYDNGRFKTVEGLKLGYDDYNQSQDSDSVRETEGDEQEHWQVESRTIDVLNSMSQLVRLALHGFYQLDKNGNKVYSKWGIAERVNPRQAVNSILRWTQGSLSLEDMITKLSAKQNSNPWVSQLIERLSDKSGKETDFQSQFYGVFSKHFQPYSIVMLEDGKYKSVPVNNHPVLTEAIQSVTTLFKVGEHPLFTANGINKQLLGSENTTKEKNPFNLHKAFYELNLISERLRHGEELDGEMSKQASDNLIGVSRILGYPITEGQMEDILNRETVRDMTYYLSFIVKDLDAAYQQGSKSYDPFVFGGKNSIGGSLRNFLTPVTNLLEDTATNAFYDSGKMYQSYVTPSYMTKLMQKFRLEGQEFKDFIMQQYGSSEWFKFDNWNIDRGWRNDWLRRLARDPGTRKMFDHKVELNFNKHNYMRNMSDAEYTLSLLAEYWAENPNKYDDMAPAWFRIPMLSNKPSSEFIKFYSYRGDLYKDSIVNGLHDMFLQELSRIQTVRMRNMSKEDSGFIKNFDTNGRKFNFLPFLNSYLEDTGADRATRTLLEGEDNNRLANLLQKKVEGFQKLSTEEEATLMTLVKKAIKNHMEAKVRGILADWEEKGIIEAAKNIKGVVHENLTKEEDKYKWAKEQVENFLWNDAYASKNILQLTIGDIAFYKDAEDLQKRLAQLHAPGIRGNIAATDYEGNRVSDGRYRTFVLSDFDNFISNIIDNVSEVFDRKIEAAPEGQKAQMRALKEELVGKNGKYRKINVTDAQAYSSPSSYRKKALIFGKWSRKAEDIYQKLLKGEYTFTDLETAFQPLKPFVYTQLQKDMGVQNAPIRTMPVPFQAKNAEYLLIMADAIIKGEEARSGKMSRPNLLRAVYRVMEESERRNPTKGIDTVQFESAIKSGLQGKMDIGRFMNMQGGEEAAYAYMMHQIYDGRLNEENGEYELSDQYNTNTTVHETSYEDYCLQQEVPEHFKEHSQAHGSQIRMITPSDLDYYKNPNGDLNDENNQVFYEWTEPDGTVKRLRADEFRREYEETIAENISQSISDLATELHLDSNDRRERNITLSKILQREILSSPRYGIDLLQACSIDKTTGEFRIPKGDPIQAKRIEQLINSIIKNRVNKQKIAGGPIVQVSNFGTSRQLHIRFNDKNGNLLKTREEYEQGQSKLQELLQGSDKTLAEAKGVLQRRDGSSDQEKQLESWARSRGIWYEDATQEVENKYGKRVGNGSESWVFAKDGHTVVKAKDNIYDNVYDALESIQIQNYLFPSTKIKLVGVGRSEGELTFIIEQPFVSGRYATKEEIKEFVEKELDGTFNPSIQGGNSYENEIYKLYDLKPANVLVDSNNNLQVVDGDFYLQPVFGKQQSYEQYVKENQAGIAYFEVFVPIWNNELVEKFGNTDGTINMEAIEATDPELLKMVSYRIPTEDKYSCAPMKVVGFMPREAGDAIMLPYELTEIDDSDFDVDKRYVMRKEIPIKKKDKEEIRQILFDRASESHQRTHGGKTANKFIGKQIRMFLDNPEGRRHSDDFMESLYREYQKVAYRTEPPKAGRLYRDNKIVDMTYAVLTNEMTAPQILNPGGFDGLKRMGYMVAAYRNPANSGISWERLQEMSIDELNRLSYVDKDLTWADAQVQFYRQNNAAASLIGVFAVNKVAHATLESNGIMLDVSEVCGENPFTIADTTFGGRMEIDQKYDQNGNLIGKTLGSGVSASADAAKTPVLNLMNINMTTVGIFSTMLRLGMPLEDASLFLSQNVIERALDEFDKRNLTNYEPLSGLIDKYLTAYRERNSISDDSAINTEPITRKELIEGLKYGDHGTIDYKVLLAFQKLRKLVDAVRKPTFVTRFNSISSAVGPLIVDNLMTEHKMEQFLDSNSEEGTHFYDRDGVNIDIDDILYEHPVLREFAKTVDIAREMFSDMPAGSTGFRNLLHQLPDGMADKVFGDKKLLDQLSNFYQSYLLVASGMINSSQLGRYVNNFPTWFMKQEFKEKYPDNALIQAIKMNVSKKTQRPYLQINIAGMDTQEKEALSNAWIDLHKAEPELSKMLFTYSFFRAGVGFSPKTFMALVPTYVKERLSSELSDGTTASYVDTYRNFPEVNPVAVIDLFIRNNWNNNKLVPNKGGEGTKYSVDIKAGTLMVSDPKDISDLRGVPYMKTRQDRKTYLWKLVGETEEILRYALVMPLGNNNEYLEMSLSDLSSPINKTSQTLEDMDASELADASPAESDTEETSKGNVVGTMETSKRLGELAELVMKQNQRLSRQQALDKIEDMRKNPKIYAGFLQNVFKQKGLSLTKEEVIKEFEKYC